MLRVCCTRKEFHLDETTYSREPAPLAGHYPALKLGPPWWFFDSLNGMARYFDQVMETDGIYNTVQLAGNEGGPICRRAWRWTF